MAYVSGAGDRLPDVLARTPGRLAIATYLLAPGFFHNLIHRHAHPHPVTAPLAPDPRLSTLALHRYESARPADLARAS